MTRKAALTVRLPGARIAPAKSTWTCGHRRLENSGTKGFSKCSIVDGRVRIITSLWRTGDDRTLPLLTLTKWTKSSVERLSKKARGTLDRGSPRWCKRTKQGLLGSLLPTHIPQFGVRRELSDSLGRGFPGSTRGASLLPYAIHIGPG